MHKNLKSRLNRLGWAWPDMASERGRRDGANFSAAAIWWIAFSYVAQTTMAILAPEIFADEFIGTAEVEVDLTLLVGLAAFAVPVATILGWYIRRRLSPAAATAIAVWVFAEIFFKLVSGRTGGTAIMVLSALGAVNGMRAAFAIRRCDRL